MLQINASEIEAERNIFSPLEHKVNKSLTQCIETIGELMRNCALDLFNGFVLSVYYSERDL